MLQNVIRSAPDAESADLLVALAAEVRASGVLGRSRLLIGLFDYLVARAVEGRSPKEREIAYEVFGRSGDFEAGQDAVVRVYAHRLRAKLDHHARTAASASGHRLTLAKGEYRIVAEPETTAAGPTLPASPPLSRRSSLFVLAGLLLAAINLAALAVVLHRPATPADLAAASPVWRPFLDSRFPLTLVVGDYYIFGESDDGMEIARLVREYGVNSPDDLTQFLMQHPDKAARYVDLGLSYLPTSSAPAVTRLSGLFAGRKPVTVLRASQLTPDMLKTHDIIYVGYLSGLGPLSAPAFSGSNYRVGESYDELIDTGTRKAYFSQGAMGPSRGGVYSDYGYFAAFRGPAGNHIAIVAGARDIGAVAAAEQVSSAEGLKALKSVAKTSPAFEALYAVTGEGDVNFQSHTLSMRPRSAPRDWSQDPSAGS
ncbi:hypothetical protein [Phenylobacterium aquaticum]|uniref:hypothetical protein n=1 Tax=Phenylobacterium aquaticum TaxID=1763816 RepID=UPI001F5D5CC2|nr:hypothetical protein [Phenylobacterium aquaticum]MCI3135506.1 hypothetical protein [Phenylobacterium aquaticum]